MGGVDGSRKEYDHEITVDGNTVCRDGHAVRIVAHRKSRDLVVGCTYVTRAALQRLLEMSTNCDVESVAILQP